MYLWRALPASQGATADARLRRGLGLDAGEPVLGRGEVVGHDCHQLVLRHLLTRAAAEETPLTATAVVARPPIPSRWTRETSSPRRRGWRSPCARGRSRCAPAHARGGQGLSGVCAACDDSPQTTDASRDLQQCCDGGHGPWSVGCASWVRTVRALAKKGMRLRLER